MWAKVLLQVCLLAVTQAASLTGFTVRPNTTVLLPCEIEVPVSAVGNRTGLPLLSVTWMKVGREVASFSPAQQKTEEGFLWDSHGFDQGNFSLTIVRVTLERQGMYVCTVSYNSTQLLSENVTLSIHAPPTLRVEPQWVVLERESRLECLAERFFPPPVFFSWTREGAVIQPPQPADAEQTPDGFYRAVGNLTFYPSRDDQNVTFGCQVTHVGVQTAMEFQLNITFVPSIRLSAVAGSSSRADPLTLLCDLDGFYPEDVTVSWVQNGTALPETPVAERNPDGTYRTSRYFTLSQEQREQAGEVQCMVGQPGSAEPARSRARLEDLDPSDTDPVLTKSAKASVALMCISLVLVFLLCFGFSWRRRDEKHKSLSVSGIILPPRVVVGQKGRVNVSIEGRRVDRVQTAWFLNDTPISDTSHTVSENGPLLPSRGQAGYYKLHSQGPLYSTGNRQQLVSSLTFIPKISVHKGAVFKCQVSYAGKDKVVVERVSERFNILAAPQVSEIQLAESAKDSDVITMTVRASHFHPDVITFRWFCEGSELSPVASQALSSPRPDSEGFFSASSQCRLPRGELERGNTKVWVSVHHVALKHPATRETRGFLRRPCVAKIVASSSSPGEPLTLGCDITGFYPPDLRVTWLRLREGEQDDGEDEVIEGGELWGPVLSGPRLYRTSATLSRAGGREETKERGRGGVVCRVEHRSLDEPIERRWKNVHVAAPSIPLSISVCWSSEGVGVFSVLLRGGQPRAKVLWTAGGATLSELVSSETEEMGDDEKPSAVTDPDVEGIAYIDERIDGENNNIESWETMKTLSEEEESEEEEVGPGALHINRVDLRVSGREQLRVCVEITHPAFTLPFYRTWTEPIEELSSI